MSVVSTRGQQCTHEVVSLSLHFINRDVEISGLWDCRVAWRPLVFISAATLLNISVDVLSIKVAESLFFFLGAQNVETSSAVPSVLQHPLWAGRFISVFFCCQRATWS